MVDNRESRVESAQGLHLSSAFSEWGKDVDRHVEDASRGLLPDVSGHRNRRCNETVQQHQTSWNQIRL